MSNCETCYHPEDNHRDGSFCTRDLTCLCQKFKEPIQEEIAQVIEGHKYKLRKISERVRHILLKMPYTINATDKNFPKIYKAVWYGFWPSKHTIYDMDAFRRMPEDDSINRERRRQKALLNLDSFQDTEVTKSKQMKFEAYLEMSWEDKN